MADLVYPLSTASAALVLGRKPEDLASADRRGRVGYVRVIAGRRMWDRAALRAAAEYFNVPDPPESPPRRHRGVVHYGEDGVYPLTSAQVGRLLGKSAQWVADLARRGMNRPPPIVAKRRLWRRDHLEEAARALGLSTIAVLEAAKEIAPS